MLNRPSGRLAALDAEAVLDTVATLETAPAPRWPALRLPWLATSDRTSALQALPILVTLLVALAINLPTVNDYFHGDDFVAFAELGTKEPLQYMVDTFTFKDVNFYWRPLGQASYLALYEAFGLSPAAFHGLSIAMFLATIWLIYRFSINAGFSRYVAAGAAALFALLPSHVVSVAWVTNSPRIMAVMFFMAGLIVLQHALHRRRPVLDLAAGLLFVLCALSDETALALAPVPVLYAAIHTGRLKVDWAVAGRFVFYAAVVASLAPLQFLFTLDDEPRLADYGPGLHMLSQTWALSSQLVLPLAEGSPLALSFQAIGATQWAAGAIALAAGAVLFVAGSWMMRLLLVWTAVALAPFTLWDIEWLSPRYVYMAAIPYAICVAWLIGAAIDALRENRRLQLALAGAITAAAVGAGALSVETTLRRNDDWANSTEPFRVLAKGLPAAVPYIPPESRIVIYYGVWHEFPLWPRVVVRTIYQDQTLDVVNVDRRNVESSFPRREPGDILVYYSDGKFLRVAPSLPAQ